MFPGSATPPPTLFRPLASMVGSGRLFELKSRQVAHSNLGSFPPRAFSVEPHAQRYAEAGDGTETPGKNIVDSRKSREAKTLAGRFVRPGAGSCAP